MAYGSYSVYVTVEGSRARARRSFRSTRSRRAGFRFRPAWARSSSCSGSLLVADSYARARGVGRESRASGRGNRPAKRRRANIVTGDRPRRCSRWHLFGGAKWWSAEDAGYGGHMFGSPSSRSRSSMDGSHRTLLLSGPRHRELSRDLRAGRARSREDDAPLPRELAENADASRICIRLQTDSLVFTRSAVGPGGRYLLFGDIMLENGLSLTVTTRVELPPAPGARDAIGQRRHVGSHGNGHDARGGGRPPHAGWLFDGLGRRQRADQGRVNRRICGSCSAIRRERWRASIRILEWRPMPSSSATMARCSFIFIRWAR